MISDVSSCMIEYHQLYFLSMFSPSQLYVLSVLVSAMYPVYSIVIYYPVSQYPVATLGPYMRGPMVSTSHECLFQVSTTVFEMRKDTSVVNSLERCGSQFRSWDTTLYVLRRPRHLTAQT